MIEETTIVYKAVLATDIIREDLKELADNERPLPSYECTCWGVAGLCGGHVLPVILDRSSEPGWTGSAFCLNHRETVGVVVTQ
jgi:hypothetical protein